MSSRNLLTLSFVLIGFMFVNAVHLPICHFLMRDFYGSFIEVMRRCPSGTSFCAARVSNATGVRSLVINHYEYYCENERNITRQMGIHQAPSQGCYRFGADADDFVCFCEEDFCNSHEKIERLFLSIHHTQKRPAPLPRHQNIIVHPTTTTELPTTTTSEPFNVNPSTLSFTEEFRRLRSPLLTDQNWKKTRSRRQAAPQQRSFEQKVLSQKFILAEEGTIFRKKNG